MEILLYYLNMITQEEDFISLNIKNPIVIHEILIFLRNLKIRGINKLKCNMINWKLRVIFNRVPMGISKG